MPKALRTAVLACAALVSLAFAGTAMAAFTPKLVVTHKSYTFGSNAQTTISLTADKDQNSIAKITIYAPGGYTATLNQAVGTQIGTVHARAQARAISPDAILSIDGVVRVADQNDATLRQQAVACTGSPTHAATWILALQAAGTPLNIPVFVDQTAGAELTFASYKLQICLTSPEIPQSQGGAAFGAKVLEATMALNGVFSNPTSAGQFVWRALFTPYVPNTGTANPAGTVETRSLVLIPQSITLSASTSKKSRSVRLSGKLTAGGAAVAGVRVTLFAGRSAKALKATGRATTNASGAFRFTRRSSNRTLFFQVRASSGVRDAGAAGCAGTSLAPAGCVNATISALSAQSRVVKVRGRKR
jgi:hypothetical protein